MILTPIDPAIRRTVEGLLRDTALSQAAIAAEAGISVRVVRKWNALGGFRRRGAAARKALCPADWPAERLAAVTRLYTLPAVDPGDLAEAMGAAAGSARRLFKACGLDGNGRTASATRAATEAKAVSRMALDGPRLRAALREHLARQIARCDATLRGSARGVDTAKALRDLTGLKRLLDEVDADARRIEGGADAAGRSDGASGPARDLPALRAGIARRYAAFAGERPAAGLPGEPAAGPDAGAGR